MDEAKNIKGVHFGLYRYTSVIGSSPREIYSIVLKNEKRIEKFTDWADYVTICAPRDGYVGTTARRDLNFICAFLNYIFIENNKEFPVTRIEDITAENVKKYLIHYTGLINSKGQHRRESSCKAVRDAICFFLYSVCLARSSEPIGFNYPKAKPEDFCKREVIKDSDGEKHIKLIPQISVKYERSQDNLYSLLRDMPLEMVDDFLEYLVSKDEEMVLAVELMSKAGLRISENAFLRQKQSCYGPNLLFDTIGSVENKRAVSLEINLRRTVVMRADFETQIGGIKKKRSQTVTPYWADSIFVKYLRHLEIIKNKPTEPSCPLFLNKTKKGEIYKGVTGHTLRTRIDALFESFIRDVASRSSNPEYRKFCRRMGTHSWGPHAFRHYFTVMLVLNGASEAEIRDYRGDKDIKSAQDYLRDKSMYMNTYKLNNDKLGRKIRIERRLEND